MTVFPGGIDSIPPGTSGSPLGQPHLDAHGRLSGGVPIMQQMLKDIQTLVQAARPRGVLAQGVLANNFNKSAGSATTNIFSLTCPVTAGRWYRVDAMANARNFSAATRVGFGINGTGAVTGGMDFADKWCGTGEAWHVCGFNYFQASNTGNATFTTTIYTPSANCEVVASWNRMYVVEA